MIGVHPLAAISTALRQRATISETAHRPWPLPRSSWFMGQSWLHLLFAHWSVDAEALARVIPAELPLDLYDGRAWIGVTPFRVEGLRLRPAPPAPLASRFLEVNVRTYVTIDGKPGIYFLSLDAASRLAVSAARRGYRLPYFHSRISFACSDGEWRFRSARTSGDGPPAGLDCRYRPLGEQFHAAPGTLEYFLTERYCLYMLDHERTIQRADIHHPPWPLQHATAEFDANTMAAPFGVELGGDPLLHYAARQDVLLWTIGPAGGGPPTGSSGPGAG